MSGFQVWIWCTCTMTLKVWRTVSPSSWLMGTIKSSDWWQWKYCRRTTSSPASSGGIIHTESLSTWVTRWRVKVDVCSSGRVQRNQGLEVEPGQARLISSAALSAQDIDTPPTEVIYVFKSVPTQGLLQLKVGAVQYDCLDDFNQRDTNHPFIYK